MKVSSIFKVLILGQVLLMATSAFATTKGGLTVQEPVTVNGTRLAIGGYEVKWEGTGPDVELSIFKSKKLVATVPAHFVELSRPEHSSAYGSEKEEDGTVSLTVIYFSGKKYKLEVGQGPSSPQSMKEGQ